MFAAQGSRVAALTLGFGVVLAAIAARADMIYADGLRYIRHAQRFQDATWREAALRAVDHPLYPLTIAAAHEFLGGDGPLSWQRAAQTVSVLAGALLIIPVFLTAGELARPRAASLACLMLALMPIPARIFADALSESTFLLFWSCGLWAALRFLREGRFSWLPLAVGFGAFAYLVRPEGLLLPAAIGLVLCLVPFIRSAQFDRRRWIAAVSTLIVVPGLIAGPFVLSKGGLGTKPGIARVLGTAPRSTPGAVERSRVLDPDQSEARTYALAAKAVFSSLRDGISTPLFPLVLIGAWVARPLGNRARVGLLVGTILLASVAALVRLHATSGYCTPRHALVPVLLLLPYAAAGFVAVVDTVVRLFGLGGSRRHALAFGAIGLLAYAAWSFPSLAAPLNHGAIGYRRAGEWLAKHAPPAARIVDLTGFAQFYGERAGYSFADLGDAPADPLARYVVVREAHLIGPWPYCELLRELVRGRRPIAQFPEPPDRQASRTRVYDLATDNVAERPSHRH